MFSSICKKLLLVSSFFLLFACHNSNSRSNKVPPHIQTALERAEKLSATNSDSTINITGKIISDSIFPSLSDAFLLEIYKLRQSAFSKKKQMDSVILTGEKIRLIANIIDDSLAMAESLLPIRGDIDFAAQQKMQPFLPGAIATFGKRGMKKEKAALSATYGAILCQMGEFTLAQTFLLSAYDIFTDLDSIRELTPVCINIGNVYAYINSKNDALFYYNKALSIGKRLNDSMRLVSALMNIGTMYSDMHVPDTALLYYQKATDMLPRGMGYYLKMKIDYNVAAANFELKEFMKAEAVYQSMLLNCTRDSQLEGIAMAYKGLAGVYNKTGRQQKAATSLLKAISIADSLGMDQLSMSLRPELIRSYEALKDYKSAFTALKQEKLLNDSLLSKEKQISVHELEKKYQTEKKELENKQLSENLKKRKIIIVILFVSALILLLLLRQRNRLYKERTNSYNVLMAKYRAEKEGRSSSMLSPGIVLHTIEEAVQESKNKDDIIFSSLILYYEREKPYLSSKLKVEEVAKYLSCTQKELAFVIKRNADLNFTGFTNKYRVEEAKRMFENQEYKHLKMATIASKSGFGSIQSFYNAFELFTGVTPAYFRSKITSE